MLKYTIPGRPISKKNSMQMAYNKATGKMFPVQSEAYKRFEKEARKALLPIPEKPVEEKVNVRCLYFMPTRSKVDLCNLLGGTCDVLVKHRVIADDNSNIVVGHDGSRVLYDKENPRTEIYIEEIADADNEKGS